MTVFTSGLGCLVRQLAELPGEALSRLDMGEWLFACRFEQGKMYVPIIYK